MCQLRNILPSTRTMQRLVIKLSGNLFSTLKSSIENILGIAHALEDIRAAGSSIIAVAGGGIVARQYIAIGRELGADEASLDQLGIEVSRLNARIMNLSAGLADEVPTTLESIVRASRSEGLVFTGGLSPGQSTNATAALIAEKTKANLFINATDVAGVYSADPGKNPNAKLIPKIAPRELRSMLKGQAMQAGTYALMDLVALKIIERSRVPTRIVKCDPITLKRAAQGKNVGTLVES